jgi:carboxymethylenebutenolidase
MSMLSIRTVTAVCGLALVGACASSAATRTIDHSEHAMEQEAAGAASQAPQDRALPPGAADASARLAASPRHGEWAMIPVSGSDSIRAWVVYPQRSSKAPVVIVVHEIFGLSTWIRAVADQLAAEGFIAIAPDMLTGKHVPGSPDSMNVDSAVAAIRTLKPDDVQRQLDAVASYGMTLPAALPKYGIVGFCWGGGISFAHAAHAPTLGASVVYYGTSPTREQLANVRAPVLGLYGEKDMRVDATIPLADSVLLPLGRTYEHHAFPGAGHGFLRAQDQQSGSNLAATKLAWPQTVAWFHKYLGA